MKKYKPIYHLTGKLTTEFQRFHNFTKIKKMRRISSTIYWPQEWKKIYYKSYGRFSEIKLPKPSASNVLLSDALYTRRSVRDFSNKKLSLKKLSNLFYYSAGIPNNTPSERRFYPSPGARFPLEVYFLSLKSELDNASYHYFVQNNSFEKMFKFNKKDLLPKITNIPWIKKTGGLIFISAVFNRNTMKYGDRGYRLMLEEAGHMAQNFYLNAVSQKIGACAIGGYVDDVINNHLELDVLEESVIYTMAIGEV